MFEELGVKTNTGCLLGEPMSIRLLSLIHRYFFFFLIYFWLCWVFAAVRGLLLAVASLVAEHGL